MKKTLSLLLCAALICATYIIPVQSFAYEFDNHLIPRDVFDQGDEPLNFRANFAMLEYCVIPNEHKTYMDTIQTDYLKTVSDLLTVFEVGRLKDDTEECKAVKQKYQLDGIDCAVNIYRKDEVNDLFNAYYGTDIDLLALPNSDDALCKTEIYDDYFVFFLPNNGYITFYDDALWRGGYSIGNANYWIWALKDVEATDQIVSDDIHTITQLETVHGYTFNAIKYISFTPPSDELLAEYDGETQALPDVHFQDITVLLNNSSISFNQQPVIYNDRTLVPMRAIFEAFGAKVYWEGETKTITSVLDNTVIVMSIGSNKMYVNDFELEIDAPPILINDYTYVPVRVIAESFDADVAWDGENKIVSITSKNDVDQVPKMDNKTQIANPWTSYATLDELNAAINEQGEVKYQVAAPATPAEVAENGYRYLAESNMAEIVGRWEVGAGAEIVIRTCPTDTDISGIQGAEKVEDFKLEDGTAAELYKYENTYYASWACEDAGNVISHSVAVTAEDWDPTEVVKTLANEIEDAHPKG